MHIFCASRIVFSRLFKKEERIKVESSEKLFGCETRERTFLCLREIEDVLLRFFSDELFSDIKRYARACACGEALEEIRLRKDRCVFLTVGGGKGKKRNFAIPTVTAEDELSKIFNRMCDGSLYAYSESIIKGYVSLPLGIRVGVCGHASVEENRIIGVYDISALNVRIPRVDIRVDRGILQKVARFAQKGLGTLIFSPPAQGKTTCLRSLAYELSKGENAMRVSVIDTREELMLMPTCDRLSLDIFSGYPKAEGIRMATLFMNPEIIICDEIGTEEEARAIAGAQNCGVPLVATAHGASLSSLLRKRGIVELHRARVFGAYVMLRIGSEGGFDYSLYTWEEAEKCFADNRSFADFV